MEDVIDLARYPIDRPGSLGWRRLADDCRVELDRNGLFNLPDFFRQEALARAIAEPMLFGMAVGRGSARQPRDVATNFGGRTRAE